MSSYLVLAVLAVILNIDEDNPRMMYLALVVSLGVFAPVPDANFYLVCGLGEVLICMFAFCLNTRASPLICWLSIILGMFHYLGYELNGYPPNSPYHLLVRICEHAELAICIICSNTIIGRSHHVS